MPPIRLLLASLAVLCGCAATVARDAAPQTTSPGAAPPAADRAAILAMAGDFRVRFSFDETVVIEPGYQRRDGKRSGALETVLVVVDEPGRIVLQHLLVSPDGGHVTKHWRQDWHWQAAERLEFTADQTWRLRPVDPDLTRGTWTQCVYEVSDAPRYCGTGRWNHRYGVATWTSDRSWRPLPRREYTTRGDYNALNVENRHTIVPGGWTHEQDNSKVVRGAGGDSRTLVREWGFNDYVRTDEVDFRAAHDWWRRTQGYWAQVRAGWDRRIRADGGIRLETAVDGMPVIEATFAQAARVAEGGKVEAAELDAVFDRWTRAPDAPAPAGALAGR